MKIVLEIFMLRMKSEVHYGWEYFGHLVAVYSSSLVNDEVSTGRPPSSHFKHRVDALIAAEYWHFLKY